MIKLYRTFDVMEILGISKKTVENYEKKGLLIPERVGRTKFFTQEMINKLLNIKRKKKSFKKKVIGYYRVTTNSQKKELINQKRLLENFSVSKGIIIDKYLYDIGSGIDFKRKNFLKIIDMIENQEISTLIITYKDRLTRFAFDLVKERCKVNDVELIVINLETTSPQEELIEDLMTIIHVFSCRLYGLRKYKSKIKKEFK